MLYLLLAYNEDTTVITPEKIEEWLKEAGERPESALLLLQFMGNRLRDLSRRNEELLTENIALMTEKRVEEYEQRIAHLEYQLDMLRREFGGDVNLSPAEGAVARPQVNWAALVVGGDGRVAHIAIPDLEASARKQAVIARLRGAAAFVADAPQLLLVKSSDELLFVFSNGRVASVPAGNLPLIEAASDTVSVDWENAPRPEEPRAGETLVSVTPIARLSLSEYLLQASRRGFVKKLRVQMAQSILANRYIGSGVKLPADRSFALVLSGKEDRLALVSHDGHMVCLDVRRLPFAIEEVLRLGPSDYLATAVVIAGADAPPQAEERTLVIMTSPGKALQYRPADIESAASFRTRGVALLSAQRRAQGARVIGAGLVQENSVILSLDMSGALRLHPGAELLAQGVLPVEDALAALATI